MIVDGESLDSVKSTAETQVDYDAVWAAGVETEHRDGELAILGIEITPRFQIRSRIANLDRPRGRPRFWQNLETWANSKPATSLTVVWAKRMNGGLDLRTLECFRPFARTRRSSRRYDRMTVEIIRFCRTARSQTVQHVLTTAVRRPTSDRSPFPGNPSRFCPRLAHRASRAICDYAVGHAGIYNSRR